MTSSEEGSKSLFWVESASHGRSGSHSSLGWAVRGRETMADSGWALGATHCLLLKAAESCSGSTKWWWVCVNAEVQSAGSGTEKRGGATEKFHLLSASP